jgi:hypothetical protein
MNDPLGFQVPQAGVAPERAVESQTPIVLGPAGWHGMDDIQTVIGLPGTYRWSEPGYLGSRITFRFDPAGQGVWGTYTLRRGFTPPEEGAFVSAPVTWVGAGYIQLYPMSGPVRFFVISRMLTDSHWRIYALVLSPVENGELQPPFMAVRSFF